MGQRVFVLVAAGIALALLLASSAIAAGGAPRVATLSGANEVPPADPDGSGEAAFTLNVEQRTVCWDYTVRNIATTYTGAHIHKAPAGTNGPIVVPLTTPDPSGHASGCSAADPALIRAIIGSPASYYVNVHNQEFPGGAIRGQLSNRGQGK